MISRKVLLLASLLVFTVLSVIIFNIVSKPYFFEMKFKPVNRVGTEVSPDYRIVFLGDSMTEILGNFDELRSYLKKYYPTKNFLLLNYGYGSTNILSATERIEKETWHAGRAFQPINDINFDLILIESFGHNPLSEYPLEEGLKKQNEALDSIIQTLTSKHPKSTIVFLATIAPNSRRYAEESVNLSPGERAKWASERSSYIKNHIEYAKSKNIPLINIYEKSLDKEGYGNIDYINTKDFIHPSGSGIYLISEEISKFISGNNLLKN